MKLVFAHDHIFYKYHNQYYSTGGLSREMLERYTNVIEKVVDISRQKELKEFDTSLTLASTPGVEFVEVPNFKKTSKILERIKAKRIINNVIRDSDALISRLPSSIGSIAVSCSKDYEKPYLIEMVACPWDALWNHSLKGKILAPFALLNTKKRVKNSDYTVYITNEFLQNRYPSRGKIVNCSNVELTEFKDELLAKRLDRINNQKQNEKIIIGTVGAVNVRHKGQQYIIKALGKLKKEGDKNFEYQLVGLGDQSYLKSIAKKCDVIDQVKFLGSMQHDEVFNWLETIDIYTQPSRQEGLPRALIEAMSRGLPAFGANTAGIPELIDRNFIFSNTLNNIKEICLVLRSFNKEIMKEQSKKNFMESRKYDKNTIDQRRNTLLKKFKSKLNESI